MIRLGVIADDFTGATDIASFLVDGGYRTVQVNGSALAALDRVFLENVDAIVVSLKSRSAPAVEAVEKTLSSLEVLRKLGVSQFYFKYCSTFDSTSDGNIGPVTDAVMEALCLDFTVLCPALPVNGRTTYHGYLFVDGVLLEESGMRDHPVTPMTDSSLIRLMEAQSRGKVGLVPYETVEAGETAVREHLQTLHADGVTYAVLDALNDLHIETLGRVVADLPFVTGGSGLGGGIARSQSNAGKAVNAGFVPNRGPAVVLSGSSSVMTNEQVRLYKQEAVAHEIDVDALLSSPEDYEKRVLTWYANNVHHPLAPLIYATAGPEEVQQSQKTHGRETVSAAIEDLFGRLAVSLVSDGVEKVIVAGGETSGAVVTALGFAAFEVGSSIAPGVPWIRPVGDRVDLALKSGNFGSPRFFFDAQEG